MKTREELIDEMAKAIYATGVALDGTDYAFGVYDDDHFHRMASALIAANIGDVTEWKERAEKEKAEKNKWKCTANDWKQRFESREKQLGELRTTSCDVVIRKNKIISEQKAEIARLTAEDAAHRAEVAEKKLEKHKRAFDKAIKLAYKIRTDFDVLSCSSCEFGYAIDTCKKIGLYDDCEIVGKRNCYSKPSASLRRRGKMAKCGKGCMPECEYFTTGGCVSPFNCPYKIETGYINSATSTTDSLTGLLMEFDEMGFCPTTVCPNPEQTAIEWKEQIVKEIQKLQAENAELRARLEKAVEPQFSNGDEVYAIIDTSFYTDVCPVTIKNADVVYEVFDGEQTTTQHRTRIFTTRAEAEARFKELKGGER